MRILRSEKELSEKMKYAVSACLLGENCKYSGGNNYHEKLCRFLEGHEVVKLCPEVMGGLPTPRTPIELKDGIAVNKDGENVHRQLTAGVRACLELLKNEGGIECVILQPRSPSCGVGKIYDGTFRGELTDGNGLLAEELLKNGYKVISADEI